MPARAPVLAKTPFAIDPNPLTGAMSAWAGLASLSRVFRSLKVPAMIEANLSLKQRARGLSCAQYVECLALLHARGGESVLDMETLREDTAMEKILGYAPPSARATAEFLDRFHDGERMEEAQKQAQGKHRQALLIEDSDALAGLADVLRGSIRAIARREALTNQATIDLDATLIESHKREAKATYEGYRGYQPLVAVWAEKALVVADEFREGNVPANMALLPCVKRAFGSLPEGIDQLYFRGDSACHDRALIDWLADEQRADGPKGFIGFAISARIEDGLRKVLQQVPDRQWKTFDKDPDGTLRQWAELDYVPHDRSERKDARPLRYVGLRLQKAQGEFFADGATAKHFAILTNRTENAESVLRWQRLKAGTVEHVHDEIKNGLGGGRMPSGKFGTNAAWWRIACLTYNLVEALRSALPDDEYELRTAKLKRLRFCLFAVAGRVVRDRRKIRLRLGVSRESIRRLIDLFETFPLLTQATG